MSTRIQVSVFENRLLVKAEEFDGPVELGREQNRDEGLYSRKGDKELYRWVVARRDETESSAIDFWHSPQPVVPYRV